MGRDKPQVNHLARYMAEYVFAPEQGKHYGNKILALHQRRRRLLVDTACDYQARTVLAMMRRRLLGVEGIIISHFHEDHISGLQEMPNVAVYGSDRFQATLALQYPQESHSRYAPSVIFEQELDLSFGPHSVRLLAHPGHTACTVLTIINDKYIHIGDELMFSNDGRPLLPLVVDKGGIGRQLDSLHHLKQFADYTLIPVHGPAFGGRKKVLFEIDNRIRYLDAVVNSKGKISYQEAVKDCDCQFLHSEWHKVISSKV